MLWYSQKEPKLLLRDAIYNLKLYINKVYLHLRDAKLPFGGFHLQVFHEYRVYLLLRDAKLLLRDSICNLKLYINKVYLLLIDAKSFEGIRLQVKNKHLLLRDTNLFLMRDSILAILTFCSLILLLSKDSSCLKNRRL